jgi:hypothetical protein
VVRTVKQHDFKIMSTYPEQRAKARRRARQRGRGAERRRGVENSYRNCGTVLGYGEPLSSDIV